MSNIQSIKQTVPKERVVLFQKSTLTITVADGITATTLTVPHGLGKAPFIDGEVSKDNSTWESIGVYDGDTNFMSAYTDSTNIYIGVLGSSVGQVFYFRYYLFFVESV